MVNGYNMTFNIPEVFWNLYQNCRKNCQEKRKVRHRFLSKNYIFRLWTKKFTACVITNMAIKNRAEFDLWFKWFDFKFHWVE